MEKTKREIEKLYKNEEFDLWCIHCKKVTKHTEYLNYEGGYLQGIICNKCGENKQMKKPAYYDCYPYIEKCKKCKKKLVILTQDDRTPEYYTEVGVVCECGEIVWFSLPVN